MHECVPTHTDTNVVDLIIHARGALLNQTQTPPGAKGFLQLPLVCAKCLCICYIDNYLLSMFTRLWNPSLRENSV